jgi:Spy/CpxP family protein refolding chaperone
MKKTLIALTLSLAIPAAAIAVGPGGTVDYRPRLERMTRTLDLSEQQQADLEALFRKQAEQRRAQREKNRAQIRAILTEEQAAKLDEMRARRMERFAGRGPCRRHPRQPGL